MNELRQLRRDGRVRAVAVGFLAALALAVAGCAPQADSPEGARAAKLVQNHGVLNTHPEGASHGHFPASAGR